MSEAATYDRAVENIKTMAGFRARATHARDAPECDDLTLRGDTIAGREVVSCAACGLVLLTWGGGDE